MSMAILLIFTLLLALIVVDRVYRSQRVDVKIPVRSDEAWQVRRYRR